MSLSHLHTVYSITNANVSCHLVILPVSGNLQNLLKEKLTLSCKTKGVSLGSIFPCFMSYLFLECMYAAAAVANMLKGVERAWVKSIQYNSYTLKQNKKNTMLLPENIQ